MTSVNSNHTAAWVPGTSTVFDPNDNAACLKRQVTMSDTVDWVGGTFIWTLHDYLGEPSENNKWPHVSSSFGSFDLTGFAKAPAWWYRSWWLANISTTDAGRPPLDTRIKTHVFCRLVESWQRPPNNAALGHSSPSGASGNSDTSNETRTLNVYTNAPYVRILVNGVPVSAPVAVPQYGSAVFKDIPYSNGNVTAEALGAVAYTDADHETTKPLATHTKFSWGAAKALLLSLDAPSLATGTGSSVYLDGEDVALVRATIVDAAGITVHDSRLTVEFSVTHGPARIAGVGNGDPADHTPINSSTVVAYHGLARAIAKVTMKATGSAESRALEALINVDAGTKGSSSSKIAVGSVGAVSISASFTVTARVTGLPPTSLEINLSTDPADSVLSVAAASRALADVGE